MNEIWQTAGAVIVSLGGGGVIVFALSSWLGKVWASRIMQKDIARYQKELEGCKAAYQKLLDENHIRFSWWHNEQAVVFRELYAKLAEMSRLLSSAVNIYKFTSAGQDPKAIQKETEEEFMKQYMDSHQYYYKNRILLYDSHIESLEKMFDDVVNSLRQHGTGKNAQSHNPQASFQLGENAMEYAKEVERTLNLLRLDFQALLAGSLSKKSNNDIGE